MKNSFENFNNNEDLVIGDDFPAHIRIRFTELAEELLALSREIEELKESKEKNFADREVLEASEIIKELEALGVTAKIGFDSLREKLEEIEMRENKDNKLIRLLCAKDFLEKEISSYQGMMHSWDKLTERDARKGVDELNELHGKFIKLKEGRLPESGATPHPKGAISDKIH